MLSENHLEMTLIEALNKSEDAVAIVSQQNVITFCNDTMATLLGKHNKSLIGNTIEALFSSDQGSVFEDRIDGDELADWFLSLKGNQDQGATELEIDTLTGVFFSVKCLPLSSHAYLIYGKDITAIKVLESERAHLQNELDFVSQIDPMTRVASRRQLSEKLDGQIKLYERYRVPFSLIITDIDHFRTINEQYGYAAGDRVLVEFSSLLNGMLRETDIIARINGTEFALLLPNTALEGASLLATRAKNLIVQQAFEVACDKNIALTSSFGVVEFCGLQSSVEAMIHRAEEALSEAKRQGRGSVVAMEQ
ncbi:sensor domain-containing diguanylate cyclase [Pseudoalteromonas sp. McH1-7]|nr:sensor domain-containing diguanylate cyclase [Pseudoalteromonas sp. McH1-7]